MTDLQTIACEATLKGGRDGRDAEDNKVNQVSATASTTIVDKEAVAPLLQVENLKKHIPLGSRSLFSSKRSVVHAVDGVSFSLARGETLGLVGESGCGKSTLGKLVMRLLQPTAGKIMFQGVDMLQASASRTHALRRHFQMVFQDPNGSLNPRMTVAQSIGVPLAVYEPDNAKKRRERVDTLLQQVGLDPAQGERYPHEFSGGQRQRIAIARALALEPELIVCDEAVSALDVSVQAHILNLLRDLQSRMNLAYLFISHDLAVVRHVSDRVAVMYLGKIVEIADADTIFNRPLHFYTQALLDAVPVSTPDQRHTRVVLEGNVPSAINPPSGCRFRTRCRHAVARCAQEEPLLQTVSAGHAVACHLVGVNA